MIHLWTNARYQSTKELVCDVLKERFPRCKFRGNKDLDRLPKIKKGDVVLAMGTRTLKFLHDAGIAPKNKKTGALRGDPIPYNGGWIVCSYSPDYAFSDYMRRSDIIWDAQLAGRLHETGSIEPIIGNYRWVNDFSDTIKWIKRRIKRGQENIPVALDLETLSLNPFSPNTFIVSISFTYKKGQADLIRFQSPKDQPFHPDNPPWEKPKRVKKKKRHLVDIWEQIKWLLNCPQVGMKGANLKYDLVWIREKWDITCSNFNFDTTLAGTLVDENRSNSLNTHAKLMTNMGGYDDSFNKTYNKGRMDLVPDNDLLTYAGGDTDATFQVAASIKNELLKDKKLARFYVNCLHPASRAFENMEYNGVLLDIDYYLELQEELQAEVQEINQKALNMLPGRMMAKYYNDFSLTRTAIIKEFMFSPRGLNINPKMYTEKAKDETWNYASTAMEHLEYFRDHEDAAPFIQLLEEFGSANKTLGTYVTGFLNHVRSDGKLHPTAILYKGAYGDSGDDSGTVTGRLAFKDPAVQTIPKHTKWAKKLRRGYICPPGYKLVQWDYSQGELRITACVANEKTMIETYNQGIDLHLVTGARVSGYDYDQVFDWKMNGTPEQKHFVAEMIRQRGKAGNFGLIYGMSAGGYQNYARVAYGVDLTGQEAADQRDAFFNLYTGLEPWHERYQNFAKEHEYVRSPLGRVRHLPMIHSRDMGVRSKAMRQAINSPVQATLSDMSCMAYSLFTQEYGNPEECLFSIMVHDSLVAYVKEDELDIWVPRVTEIMETLPFENFGWYPQLRFITDCEVGDNMADLMEWKDFVASVKEAA